MLFPVCYCSPLLLSGVNYLPALFRSPTNNGQFGAAKRGLEEYGCRRKKLRDLIGFLACCKNSLQVKVEKWVPPNLILQAAQYRVNHFL